MSKITEVTLALFGKQSGHNRREGDKLYQQALVSHLYPIIVPEISKVTYNLSSISNSFNVRPDISNVGIAFEGLIRTSRFDYTQAEADVYDVKLKHEMVINYIGTREVDYTQSDADIYDINMRHEMTVNSYSINFVDLIADNADDIYPVALRFDMTFSVS